MAQCKFHESRFLGFILEFIFSEFLIAMLLLGIADSHFISSSTSNLKNKTDPSLLWITEDLSESAIEKESSSAEEKSGTLTSEFLDVLIKLYNDTVSQKGKTRTYFSEDGKLVTVVTDKFNIQSPEEEMQSDQSVNDNFASRISKEELNKTASFQNQKKQIEEDRMKQIQIKILIFTGWNKTNSSRSRGNGTVSHMKVQPVAPVASNHTIKIESFRPSCAIPNNVRNEWSTNGDENMFAYFDIDFQDQSLRVFNITQALLRLYKLPSDISDSNSHVFNRSIDIGTRDPQSKIFINIYMVGMKKDKKAEHILLQNSILPVSEEKLTTWDIKQAVDTWRHNKEKNLGLLIEIEDEKKRKLPAHLFFKKIDCSENFGETAPSISLDLNNLPEKMKSVLLDITFENLNEEPQSLPTHKPMFGYGRHAIYRGKTRVDKSQNRGREKSNHSPEN